MKNSDIKNHYAWKIILALVVMKLGSSAVANACYSNYVTPIVQELGCKVSEFTLFMSLDALAMAFLYTTVAKVFAATKKLGIVLGVATIFELLAVFLMSTYHSVYMFYISGLMLGAAQSFTGFVALPMIINMWFRKQNGTILGAITAVGSAVGLIYSRLTAWMITTIGWRQSYVVLAVMGAVISLPAIFLFMKKPEEVGCQPYGAEEAADAADQPDSNEWGLTVKQAFSMSFLYVAWIACVLYSYGCGVQGYSTTYTTMELGQTISFGSWVGICMGIGTVFSSLIVGRLNDRFGVNAGLAWGTVTTGIGYAFMIWGSKNPYLTLPGAFVLGLGYCMYMVQCPLMARKMFGGKHFSDIWSRMMMVNSLIGGGLSFTIAMFYDKLGSYKGAFVMGGCLYAAAMVFGMIAMAMASKRSVQKS